MTSHVSFMHRMCRLRLRQRAERAKLGQADSISRPIEFWKDVNPGYKVQDVDWGLHQLRRVEGYVLASQPRRFAPRQATPPSSASARTSLRSPHTPQR